MGKLNAYAPIEKKYKNYLNSTTKPFKSNAEGYKEKVWTLPEQIHKKLKKAAQFIQEFFLIEDSSQKTQIKKVEDNFEILCKDLEYMENSLKKEPYQFNKSKLKINTGWILEMKMICETIKKSVFTDKMELKKLGKLEHVLTELEHIIKPERDVKDASLFKKGFHEVKAEKKSSVAQVKKGSAKKVAHKKVKAKPIAKSKKPVMKAAHKKVKAKPIAKSKKPVIKAASKKKAKVAAPVKKVKTVAKSKKKP